MFTTYNSIDQIYNKCVRRILNQYLTVWSSNLILLAPGEICRPHPQHSVQCTIIFMRKIDLTVLWNTAAVVSSKLLTQITNWLNDCTHSTKKKIMSDHTDGLLIDALHARLLNSLSSIVNNSK